MVINACRSNRCIHVHMYIYAYCSICQNLGKIESDVCMTKRVSAIVFLLH